MLGQWLYTSRQNTSDTVCIHVYENLEFLRNYVWVMNGNLFYFIFFLNLTYMCWIARQMSRAKPTGKHCLRFWIDVLSQEWGNEKVRILCIHIFFFLPVQKYLNVFFFSKCNDKLHSGSMFCVVRGFRIIN